MKIHIEDKEIHDGWCALYDTATGQVKWRDIWFTNELTPEFKRIWEEQCKENMKHLKEKEE